MTTQRARTPQRIVACALAAALLAGPLPVRAAGEAMHRHVTERGDTLIGLGRRFLVDPARWPEIARANRLRNPDRIGTGVPILIPLSLMRTEPEPAVVLRVSGQAQSADAPLAVGQALVEGSRVQTGEAGHVTLRLVDGTVLRLRPGSQLTLTESRRVSDTPVTRAGALLDRGRVEVEATPAAGGRPGFEIGTPQGILGVRGTAFRVAAADALSRGEVLEGEVAVDSRAGGPGQRVTAGFGTVVPAGAPVAPPVALLPPPDLSMLPALQDQILVRFALPATAGARSWRGQIAGEAGFDLPLADLTSASPELRFAGLPDGDYVLRVRAIDAQGLEGQDASLRFRLKARPEAPMPAAPAPRSRLFGDSVELAWAANVDATSYRLQIASDPGFGAASLVRDLDGLTGLGTVVDGLPPGRYHWRLGSVRRLDGGQVDPGPWGAGREFELRPLPPEPKPPAVDDKKLSFAWDGRPGQSFDFQLARDPDFAAPLVAQRLATPGIELPTPGTGRFHIRLRAIEPDGFVGPWTATQYFDVPNCVRDGAGGCVRVGDHKLTLGH